MLPWTLRLGVRSKAMETTHESWLALLERNPPFRVWAQTSEAPNLHLLSKTWILKLFDFSVSSFFFSFSYIDFFSHILSPEGYSCFQSGLFCSFLDLEWTLHFIRQFYFMWVIYFFLLIFCLWKKKTCPNSIWKKLHKGPIDYCSPPKTGQSFSAPLSNLQNNRDAVDIWYFSTGFHGFASLWLSECFDSQCQCKKTLQQVLWPFFFFLAKF